MKRSILCIILIYFSACIPGGGFMKEGGHISDVHFQPSATRISNAKYEIICVIPEKEKEWLDQLDQGENPEPPIYTVKPENYRGDCKQTGMSSVFFLFNLIPVTSPLNPDYAMSMAVQRLEGDSMIHISSWMETHYYTILGRVSVFKIRGDVIRFINQGGRNAR